MKLKDALIAIFALALLGSFAFLWLAPAGLTQVPAITVTTLDGTTIDLSEVRSGPLLVSFWATTCPGCIKEMPHLVELYREFSPRGLQLIGIAMDYDPPNQVIALTEARKIPYPIALDIRGEAAKAFGEVRLTPTSFLIAPDGHVIHQKTGELDMDKVRSLLRDMLAGQDSPAPRLARH